MSDGRFVVGPLGWGGRVSLAPVKCRVCRDQWGGGGAQKCLPVQARLLDYSKVFPFLHPLPL